MLIVELFLSIDPIVHYFLLDIPGYIDPNRLHILYFKKSIEKKIGRSPWMVMPSIK